MIVNTKVGGTFVCIILKVSDLDEVFGGICSIE